MDGESSLFFAGNSNLDILVAQSKIHKDLKYTDHFSYTCVICEDYLISLNFKEQRNSLIYSFLKRFIFFLKRIITLSHFEIQLNYTSELLNYPTSDSIKLHFWFLWTRQTNSNTSHSENNPSFNLSVGIPLSFLYSEPREARNSKVYYNQCVSVGVIQQ